MMFCFANRSEKLRLRNGHWETASYNERLQVTQIGLGVTDTTQNLLKLEFKYEGPNPSGNIGDRNNGSMREQKITVPTVGSNQGFTAIQSYTYDALNRIDDANETIGGNQTWRQDFTYDRYGNRNFNETNTTTIPKNCGGAICQSDRNIYNPGVNADGKNRLNATNGYGFDSAGNMTADPQDRLFTYDAENKQVKVENIPQGDGLPFTVGQYFYDGSGKRIKKVVPSTNETIIFVYDIGERIVAEYTINTQVNPNPQVEYTTTDHMGSPRVITDASGQVTSRRDFMPFGEKIELGSRTISLNYNSDDVDQKFTGKQRDNETGLDFFGGRYYSSLSGRFISSDKPFLDQDEVFPQSWNIYVYTRNNPLKYIDELGYEISYATPELKTISDALRAKSATYDAALKGFEGDGAPNLDIRFGDAGKDADGSTADGDTTTRIQRETQDREDWSDVTDANGNDESKVKIDPGKPAKLKDATITIDNRVKDNADRTEEVLGHEVGHADDARRNPKTHRENTQKTDREKGRTPHDKRPEEIIANNFQKAVAAEKKATEKALEKQKNEENKRRKEEEKRRKEEEKQKRRQVNAS